MLDENLLALWGVVEGDFAPFKILIHRGAEVIDLQQLIKREKKEALRGFDASDLVLYMLNKPEPVEPQATLEERIRLRGDVATFTTQLTATQSMEVFPEQPLKHHVYFLVQRPARISLPLLDNSRSFLPPSPPLNVYPRRDTVMALYKRLKKYPFIQVRGTPGSGKTVLAQLLAAHISQQLENHDVHIIWINGWPQKEVKESGNYYSYLKQQGWDELNKTVFIFDQAQETYNDPTLWNAFFKSMHDFRNCRAIIFASYGSPTLRFNIGPYLMIIPHFQRVTLRHIDHKDDLPPVGLLFTRSEFDDLVAMQYPPPNFCFDLSFFDGVFGITNGHVGAIQCFINIVVADDSYYKLKCAASQLYTWNSFLAAVSPGELQRKLENSFTEFKRGLPSDEALQSPATASVFSAVLCRNVVKESEFETDEKNALQECFRNGWLHADKLGDINLLRNVGYFFPSSLHRWCVEWKLSNTLPKAQFHANSLLDFVIDVIRQFSRRNILAERSLGPGGIQRTPEEQYQDEMYRCCHLSSNGSLVTFPEFGRGKGRVDFYIPDKHWGIELLCDGNQLASHRGRFSNKEAYRTALPLSEYIIVDCRTTHPTEEHTYMSELFHAVFEDNFQRIYILDNKPRVVSGGKFLLEL